MKRLFSPCTRYRDQLESQGSLEEFRGRHPARFQELNLDVSTEELLSAERALTIADLFAMMRNRKKFLSVERAFTYEDLYAMLGNADTLAWLTPHAFVIRHSVGVFHYCLHYWSHLINEEGNESCYFRFSADGKHLYAFAHSPEHLLEIFNVVLGLLAASVVHSLTIHTWKSRDVSISATSLAYLMEQCHTSLKTLTLYDIEMDENHCRVLGDFSRPDLEIVLDGCRVTSAGTNALAAILGRNQGPTKLACCKLDYSALANGLRGNSRLRNFRQSLRPLNYYNTPEDSEREALLIAGNLRENKGLVKLGLRYGSDENDDTWVAVCDSLKTHPTLEVFDFRLVNAFVYWEYQEPPVPPEVIESRVQVLLDLLQVNTSIHTLRLDPHYEDNEIFQE